VAPNELSYITAQAWADIYGRRRPTQLQKHPDIISAPPGGVYGLANTPNDHDHARMRRLMAPGFSEKAVRSHESVFTEHIDHLIAKIQSSQSKSIIDLKVLLHAVTFDIITDSMLGESANTLEKGTDWMSLIIPLARGRIVNTVASSYVRPLVPLSSLIHSFWKRLMY
jgi:cytochrome P450